MSAARIVLLLAALAVPALVALGAWRFVLRRQAVARALGGAAHAGRLVGEEVVEPPVARLALVLAAALALGVSLADPRWGAAGGEAATAGGPVVVVVDVSSSMLARDASPDRLTRAKASLRDLIASLGGRPIGIVAFAGQAVTLTPPTIDPGAVDLYLDALDPEMVTQSGSAVVAAVRQALSVLVASEGEGGTVVLFTDGDGVEDAAGAAEISRMAGRAGLPIFTVGIGTAAGAQVPDIDFATGREVGVKREPSGEPAVSRLREELLRSIARESGGGYIALAESGAQERLADAVASARSAGGASRGGAGSAQPRFAWFAALALALLLLEGAMRMLASRRRATLAMLALAILYVPACTREVEVGSDRAGAERRLAELRATAEQSPRSARARYNLGTALLLATRYPEARPHLRVAAAAQERPMRQRAEYNSGNTHLEPAFEPRPDPRREQSLRDAIEAYKRALLLDPRDADAMWNLELARRLLREQPPSPDPEQNPDAGGGGGGGGGAGGGGADPQSGRRDPRPQPGGAGGDSPELSPEAAEELLSAAEERELSVQQEQMKRPQPPNPSAH